MRPNDGFFIERNRLFLPVSFVIKIENRLKHRVQPAKSWSFQSILIHKKTQKNRHLLEDSEELFIYKSSCQNPNIYLIEDCDSPWRTFVIDERLFNPLIPIILLMKFQQKSFFLRGMIVRKFEHFGTFFKGTVRTSKKRWNSFFFCKKNSLLAIESRNIFLPTPLKESNLFSLIFSFIMQIHWM